MSSDILAVDKDHPARSRKLPWYQASLDNKLSPEARKLFEQYSKIPAQEIETHIYKVVSYFLLMLDYTSLNVPVPLNPIPRL